ncbi:hypothetical protein O3G_MSEX001207 [Manduca sexta]|uniref:Cyclin-dependent kinase inhibitor domain-containing protein n=1 Tax=Manduca sexta TaxID=7130 RepID=A0A921YJE5_MANSE|nr:hypothetical protein O3G_MSEX001207 [Manduca sexta]
MTTAREPSQSAVKSLFPDREFDREASYSKALNMMKEFITADAEGMRAKWNFDAVNDRPLDGAIKWEKGDDRYTWIGYSGKSNKENGEAIEAKVKGEDEGEGIKSEENGLEV